ncbi:MAG: FG-GAP-like repeat-containing protein, partial [Mucilaginibacter sp.]
TVFIKGVQQTMELMPSRGFQSSVEPVLNFGLGNSIWLDSLVVHWPDMKKQVLHHLKADTLIELKQAEAVVQKAAVEKPIQPLFTNVTASIISGNIKHKENNFVDFNQERLIPKMLSTEGPKLAVADVNSDGLEDFFMGGAAGDTAKLFIQQANGHFTQSPQYAFAQDKDNEDVGAEFFDADGDGDMDLVVASGGNELHDASLYLFTRLYINDGKGHFARSFRGWPPVNINASCVRTGDFDGDGKPDVFIGARSVTGIYGKSPASMLLKNTGKGNFVDVTQKVCPALLKAGMVTDALWTDIDNDGKSELVITGDWMPLTLFKYEQGQLKKVQEIANSSGWWNCLALADINGDGKPALIAGNNGLNSKIKADKQHPATLFVSDFDNNGSVECIPVYYKTDGKAYPFNLYGDVIGQMPGLKKTFLQYSQYAGASIEKMFTPSQLEKSEKHTVEQSQSCIFYNDGKGNFTMQPLPQHAQFAPMFAALCTDLNGDGKKDIFMAGNFYGLKPEVGRYDASYGVALMANAKGTFDYKRPLETGLFIKGEVRDIKTITTPAGECIIVARNNEPLEIYIKNR